MEFGKTKDQRSGNCVRTTSLFSWKTDAFTRFWNALNGHFFSKENLRLDGKIEPRGKLLVSGEGEEWRGKVHQTKDYT